MSDTSLLVLDDENGIPLLDSRVAAKELGIEHKSLRETIEAHSDSLMISRFETAKSESAGRPEKFYLLTERQTLLLITMVKNTEEALIAKTNLVDAFMEMRRQLDVIKAEDLRKMMKKLDDVAESLYEQITWSYSRVSRTDPVNKELLKRGEKTLERLLSLRKELPNE